MAQYNYGTLYAYNFMGTSIVNHGFISAYNYDYMYTTNYGTIEIDNDRVVNLGKFELKRTGELVFNGFRFRANEKLEPEFVKYLKKHGGEINQTPDSIFFSGKFRINIKEMKELFPNLFSKYSHAPNGSEKPPGAWFARSYDRVSSVSKRTGETRLWRYRAIDKKYSLQTAITDLYCGSLAHRIVGAELAPKVTMDVFNKAVLTHDLPLRNPPEDQIAGNALEQDKLLLAICKAIVLSQGDVTTKLNALLPKQESAPSYVQSFSKLFFKQTIPQSSTPKRTRADLIDALRLAIDAIGNDNYRLSQNVIAAIRKDLEKGNNKFTNAEIHGQINPTLDALMQQTQANLESARDHLLYLQAQAPEANADLVERQTFK